MKTSRFSFMGTWTKATMKIPGMMISSLSQKKMPRTLPPTTTQQQEGSCTVDHRLQKMTGMPVTTPAMMVATATAPAAAMAAATMTPAHPPVQASQDLRDLLVVVRRVFRRCAHSR
jgi:hypothetical protein